MKKTLLLLFIFSLLHLHSQKDSVSVRDQALDNMISIAFDARGADLRGQLERFEDQTAIKLYYKIEDETLSELGGLSKHLFKIYQSITQPASPQVKTLSGSFSAVENGELCRRLSYSSYATPDVASCALPTSDLQGFDSLANQHFRSSFSTAADVDESPAYVNDFLKQSVYQYSDIYNAHYERCDSSSSKKLRYEEHVIHTRYERKTKWFDTYLALANILQELANTQEGGMVQSTTLAALSGKTEHVATLNNALSTCARKDLNAQSELLYRHTGIHFYYLSAQIDFLLPRDSMQLFVDQVAQHLFTFDASGKHIVALWLKLKDPSDGQSYSCLLLAQNGNHLNRADINFARWNNSSHYRDASYQVYQSLYTQIRKPLILCYQTLKANGLLTTLYLRKRESLKGARQIYVQVFKYDQQLPRLNELEAELSRAANEDHVECKTCPRIDQSALHAEKRKILSASILKTKLLEAPTHFKTQFLCEPELARWAAWQWARKEFPNVFSNTIGETLSNYWQGEQGYELGTCDQAPDVLKDVLTWSSILLAPVQLDFIPDALSVAYSLSKGDYGEASAAAVFVFAPGNLQAVKRLLYTPEELVSAVNKGAKLLRENGVYKAIDPEQDALMRCFQLSAHEASSLPAKAVADLSTTRTLLALTTSRHVLVSNVNTLPKPKREAFLNAYFDNAAFREEITAKPELLWHWASALTELNGIKKVDFLNSVNNWPDQNAAEKSWYLFSNKRFDELEKYMTSNNMNGQYPPMAGFLNLIKTAICTDLKDMVFDRYQDSEVLKGSFASPMKPDGQSYSFESRALHPGTKYTHYIKFKLLDPCKSNLIFTFGEAMKWFSLPGGAVQIKSNVNFILLKEGLDIKLLEIKKL